MREVINNAVISLGSNIDPDQNIQKAKELLQREQKVLGESTFVRTKPIGNTAQPDFINGALLISTELGLSELIARLKKLERMLGRKKSEDKFGPRPIDIDVVIWNGKVIDNDFYERSFVQNAVLELLPDLQYR